MLYCSSQPSGIGVASVHHNISDIFSDRIFLPKFVNGTVHLQCAVRVVSRNPRTVTKLW